MMAERHYSAADRCLVGIDQALRTLFGRPQLTERPDPARQLPEAELTEAERTLIGRLMRINHAGEVCAQALYQGQALTARLPEVRERMDRAAREENDHLDWCAKRLEAMGARQSLLNPLWYVGSFLIGAAAGLAGDRWSLGFVVETERQVEAHLDAHLDQLPNQDLRTRAILAQMKEDEIRHAHQALAAGGAEFPAPVKEAMALASRVMTGTTYWL